MIQGRVLILGGSGMVGRAWREMLSRAGAAFDAPGRDVIDLEKPESIRQVERGGWPVVVNCAAMTDVDAAERDPAAAMRINGDGVGALATACARSGAALIHYSTDYVFSGRSRNAAGVGHVREPVNAYGRTKSRGEELIETSGATWLIVRTSWVYAPWGRNFVRAIARSLQERPSVRVVEDQVGRPTSAEHLARATMRLLESEATGIWHIADGGEPCSRLEMAREIASQVRGAGLVEGMKWDEARRDTPAVIAARPSFSVLDLSRTIGRLGPMPDWRVLVAGVVGRLE
jgi:dTDP-4-dehydrorhamnose reductase